jgi:malonate decarboxylase beta subunit
MPCLVGAAASGNLEILVEPADLGGGCEVEVNTAAHASGATWAALLDDFHARHQLSNVRIAINDGGAVPAVITLRLNQAAGAGPGAPASSARPESFRAATARERLAGLLDAGSGEEFLPPSARVTSPHLAEFDLPAAFDDGVVVGRGALDGKTVFFAAQDGRFMGGAAGEVHSAKIVGLLQRAARERPAAVLLLLDSGGVRLHEANAALIGVSEVLRSVLGLRGRGIPVLALVGGANGCFGGMSIVARCCDTLIMSEDGRLGLSGPEVIETAHGPGEFDSKDRTLVWRTMGGRHRYVLGDCDRVVADDIAAFAAAAIAALSALKPFNLDGLAVEQAILTRRARRFGGCRDADEIWRRLGASDPEALSRAGLVDFVEAATALRREGSRGELPVRTTGAGDEETPGPWRALADQLFPEGHAIHCAGHVLAGEARVAGRSVAVVGTAGHAPIGFEIALAFAAEVLRVIRAAPQRPLIILVDTQGHRLSRQDELLGLSRFMAHLAQCIDLARVHGHPTVGLVYDQAVSAGFFVTGLMADACHALPATTIHVMGLNAMARVMKVPVERLAELARSHPVFAPGAENFVRMGTIDSIWDGDLAGHLARAIQTANPVDRRSEVGLARGGRQLAHPVAQRVAGTNRPA